MRQSPMLDFPPEEYERRIGRLVEKMDGAGLDAVLITLPENTRYFCGMKSIVWISKISTPGALVITKNGQLAMIGSASAVGTILETTCLEESQVYYYGRRGEPGIPQSYPAAIGQIFLQLGLQRGRIGLERMELARMHMAHDQFEELKTRLPDAQWMDCSRIVWSLRVVKSPREIECVRRVCAINDQCYEDAFDSIAADKTTERDIYHTMARTAYRMGCDNMLMMGILYGRNETNSPPSDRVVSRSREHAILLIDGGPSYKGYYGDIIREAVMGSLTRRQEYLFKTVNESLHMVLDRIKEGVQARELSTLLDGFMHTRGLDGIHQTAGWLGHGIGLDVHESPQIAKASDYVLQAGMTLSIEPLLNDPENGVFCTEENILVTKDGYELLSRVSPEMRIL